MANMLRILCVDDHELLAEGLASRMSLENDLQCVGRLSRADDVVAQAKSLAADLVLLDLEMPGLDPLEALAYLRRALPAVKVVILSAHVKDHYLDQAIERGASGYFLKSDSPQVILDGLRRVASDEVVFSAEVEQRLGAMNSEGGDGSRLRLLTPRELDVLRHIGQGLSRADIAQRMHRSIKTIDAHHTSIMKKLDIHDRAELTRYAIREGLAKS